MRTLIVVGLLAVACGYSNTTTQTYSVTGRWQIYASPQGVPLGWMIVQPDFAGGSLTDGADTFDTLTAHAFSPDSPDFSITFSGASGTRTITGHMVDGEHSEVFIGTKDTATIQGTFFPH